MNTTTVEQDFILQILRDGKAVRDAEGIVDEKLDALLVEAEAGNFSRYSSAFVPGADNGPHGTPRSQNNNGTGRPGPAKASEKQVAFIVSLSEQVKGTKHEYLGLSQAKAEALTKVEASNVIGELKAAADSLPRKAPEPRKIVRAERKAAEPGLYNFQDTIVKVQSNRAHTGVYAKRFNLDTGEYVYTAGLQYQVSEKLTLDDALTIAQDAQHALNGSCVLCGRELTDELSISLGIGTVCREKF